MIFFDTVASPNWGVGVAGDLRLGILMAMIWIRKSKRQELQPGWNCEDKLNWEIWGDNLKKEEKWTKFQILHSLHKTSQEKMPNPHNINSLFGHGHVIMKSWSCLQIIKWQSVSQYQRAPRAKLGPAGQSPAWAWHWKLLNQKCQRSATWWATLVWSKEEGLGSTDSMNTSAW